jgi:NADPH:quinone reductase
MRVVWVPRFGDPQVLAVGEAPDPVAGAGEVVIEVAVADVLFLDAQLRSGWGREYFDTMPPYVPGSGVAGRVIATGQGVDPGWAGRRVVAILAGGGYAERVAAKAEGLAQVPDGLGMREAAALVQTGPAALSLLDAARLEPGEWVLVMPAAGGLGSVLVQLAQRAGARVIAAAGGQPKLELARDLGAEVVVDYAAQGWTERVRDAAGGVGPAVVFDGVGGPVGLAAFEAAADGSRFFAYGVPAGGFAAIDPARAAHRGIKVTGIEQVQFTPAQVARLAGQVLAEAAAGRIRPVIGRTFPLEAAADAHAAVEARTVVGRTLLLVR